MDKLYYTEEYINGKLVDNTVLQCENTEKLNLSTEDSHEFVSILFNNETKDGHRCISVYRDAIVIGVNTYNVCLSCGDFYENNRHYYLSTKGIEEFKKLKKKLINNE